MKQEMRLKRINLSLAIDNKTDPTKMVDTIQEIIMQLEERGITKSYSIGGVTADDRGG